MVGAVAIGFAPIFVRLSETGPTATAFWRMGLALPPLILWAAFTRDRSPSPKGSGGWRLVALAGLCFAADLAVWHWSILFTSVANATLEANLSAIFVPLIAWLLFGLKVRRHFIVAMAVTVLGTVLLVGKNAHISAQTLRGDMLGVLSAVFYSGYLLSLKAARDRGIGTAGIMLTTGGITAAALLPVALVSGETLLPSSAQGWSMLLGLALVSHFGGQSLITYALAGLPASFAAVGLLLQPATAALAAWAFLSESLAPAQLLGGVILMAGLLMARRNASPPNV